MLNTKSTTLIPVNSIIFYHFQQIHLPKLKSHNLHLYHYCEISGQSCYLNLSSFTILSYTTLLTLNPLSLSNNSSALLINFEAVIPHSSLLYNRWYCLLLNDHASTLLLELPTICLLHSPTFLLFYLSRAPSYDGTSVSFGLISLLAFSLNSLFLPSVDFSTWSCCNISPSTQNLTTLYHVHHLLHKIKLCCLWYIEKEKLVAKISNSFWRTAFRWSTQHLTCNSSL